MSTQAVRSSLAVLPIIGELMTGTFYLLVIAIRLIVGGLAVLIGLVFPVQVIVAAIVAMFDIVGLWRMRYGRMTCKNAARSHNINLDIGETLHVDA